MKNTFKKALAIILSLLMLMSVAPAVLAATEVASGTAGEGVNWVLDSDGTLTISGNGEIKVGWYEPPWKEYNDSILNIVIEEGITLIPSTAFCNAEKCVSISIPASVETIETSTTPFWEMYSLEKFIVDENSTTFKSIDGILFTEDGKTLVYFPANYGITEYIIPVDVNSIAENAFHLNRTVKKITVPDTVTSIGESAFGAFGIKEISLGNGITEIPTYCFRGTDIKSFVIPDSVTSLGFGVFYYCDELENLVIGSGVETIAPYVVYGTDKLSAVHYNGTQESWDKITINADNEYLMAKELHFVAHKEGVDPTCTEGHTAGLYCSDCEKYISGEVIDAVAEHNFNGDNVCDSCDFVCDHETAAYVQTAETHQFKCEVCGRVDEPEVHDIGYFNNLNDETCAPYCYDCGFVEVFAQPHSMTAYDTYDDEYCIIFCENCGYGNEETGLVEHSFTEISVPASKNETAHTNHLCVNCKYLYKEYNTENAIVFKLYSENEAEWEESAILAYVNGKPVTLIRNMSGTEYDTFALPYDKNSSYVFKWINAGHNEKLGVEIYLPDSEEAAFSKIDMREYEMLQTICTVNVADYTDVDAALAQIPDYLEYYSADSVAALVTAVKGVERMLPAGKQADVDAMAAAVNAAVNGLVELENPVPNGVINMSAGNDVYINNDYYSDNPCYVYYNEDSDYETIYEYDGKYVILETESKDGGEEDYVHYGISTYAGEVELDLVNTYITGYFGNLGVYFHSSVTLNLFGANALASYESYYGYAGIEIDANAKLHINDSNGSLIAIGEDNSAGIGSRRGYDNGEIIIDGSTIFALSVGDGAGIGSGFEGSAGKITINGGTIWAECMSDDGAGIGVGDDGNGGDIIINGGDITALSIDDDGAGIGGADSGSIDSITINGGNIVAGSEDGAAIGGGQYSDSFGGKITINGGNISASEWHDDAENLIGNGNSDSKGESEDNFVQINGGNINVTNSKGISPAPKDKNGNVLEKKQIVVHDSLIGQEITVELSDGSKITVTATDKEVSVYAPKNVSVSNETDLATGYCDHMCHQGGIMGFFWMIFNFFSMLFGTNPVCGCGAAHY